MSATMTTIETTTETAVAVVNMTGQDFVSAVTWAATAASTDKTLPVLNSVNVSFGDTPDHYDSDHSVKVSPYGVTFTATDRYRLLWGTAAIDPQSSSPTPFSVSVDAKALVAVAKSVPKPARGVPATSVTVTVTVDTAHEYEPVRFDVLVGGQLTASRTIGQPVGEFPRFRNLIPTFERDSGSPAGAAVSAHYLATIATAAGKAKGSKTTAVSLRAHGGADEYARKPVAIAVCDQGSDAGNPQVVLSGLLMPVRLAK